MSKEGRKEEKKHSVFLIGTHETHGVTHETAG